MRSLSCRNLYSISVYGQCSNTFFPFLQDSMETTAYPTIKGKALPYSRECFNCAYETEDSISATVLAVGLLAISIHFNPKLKHVFSVLDQICGLKSKL